MVIILGVIDIILMIVTVASSRRLSQQVASVLFAKSKLSAAGLLRLLRIPSSHPIGGIRHESFKHSMQFFRIR